MLEKIKEHKMLIAILALLVVSNLFTIALFYNEQIRPEVKIKDPGQTNIITDSPGSSVNGDVTNNPIAETTVVKKGEVITKVVKSGGIINDEPAPICDSPAPTSTVYQN